MCHYHILFNDNIEFHARQRGIWRVFQKAVYGAIDQFKEQVIVFSPIRSRYHPAHWIHAPQREFGFRGSHRLKINSVAKSLHKFRLKQQINIYKPRLIINPYYDVPLTHTPYIVFLYDMIQENSPQYFPQINNDVVQFIKQKQQTLKHAKHIISISQNSANDLMTLMPEINPQNVTVAYLGVDKHFFLQQNNLVPQKKPYFLYVGNRDLYKNFKRLLAAFGRSGLTQTFDLQVISPLHPHLFADETIIGQSYGCINAVKISNNVSEKALVNAYQNATAFIYPSEYEGFGLPILEAMASGTIVATSATSSMPEVGGDVAFYFDPFDIDSIASCLIKISKISSDDRAFLIASGVARARGFSWESFQAKVNRVISDAISV